MKVTVPQLLTFNGGYSDTAGFLALHGLFTAHVTGNFVTFGASLVHGTSGAVAKLLALPMFCLIVMLSRLSGEYLTRRGLAPLRSLIGAKAMLFALGAVLAVAFGPFGNGDSLMAIVTGMVLVSAMAIQNAVHKLYFPKAPPTTLMTGSTTQAMIDLADLMHGGLDEEARKAARARCISLVTSICIFAIGCGAAAIGYMEASMWVFVLPAVLAVGLFLFPPRRAPAAA